MAKPKIKSKTGRKTAAAKPIVRNHPLTLWRKKQKPPVSCRQIARGVGVEASTISRIERRERNCGTDVAKGIRTFTHQKKYRGRVTLDELIL